MTIVFTTSTKLPNSGGRPRIRLAANEHLLNTFPGLVEHWRANSGVPRLGGDFGWRGRKGGGLLIPFRQCGPGRTEAVINARETLEFFSHSTNGELFDHDGRDYIPVNGDFSLVAVACPIGSRTETMSLFGNSSAANWLSLEFYNEKIHLGVGGSTVLSTRTAHLTGIAHTVVASWRQSTKSIALWVDGAAAGEKIVIGGLSLDDRQLHVGASGPAHAQHVPYRGLIGEVAIFCVPLLQDAVSYHWFAEIYAPYLRDVWATW